MISAIDATELVVFAALDGHVSGATVYQDVPEDTPPPVVVIGDMDATPIGTKDDPDRVVSFNLMTVVEAQERRPLSAIQQQLEQLLDGKSFTAPGWAVSIVLESVDGAQMPDGATYLGNSRFLAHALTD